ncbi:MAG: hypothetical protein Q8S75_00035 [Nitrospirota bacterium]|nr:hypothetical protein [Nitrospirota bacterium]
MDLVEKQVRAAIDPVLEDLLMGLITDLAASKQYCLERAVRGLCGDEWTDKAKLHFKWKEGIEP